MTRDLVLDIRNLQTHYVTPHGTVRAVDGIDLPVERGKTLCIVGESGSGKSATARSILQLIDAPGHIVGGSIDYREQPDSEPLDILSLKQKGPQIRGVRGKHIAMVFQEPMSSLSPLHTIGNQIVEMLELHEGIEGKAARERTIEELRGVGIRDAEHRIDAYTFQLSGGMRQRAMIAMALICRPQVLIADEPTTALDVTTQAQILDLFKELKDRLGMTLIFITHDLGVVAEIADEVAVMKDGKVVEQGGVDDIFHNPTHEYTRSLLANLPQRQALEETADSPVAVARPRVEPATVAADAHALLTVDDLRMHFSERSTGRRASAGVVKAVDGVSLQVRRGETVGLVGESGCGKTTLGRCLLGAYKPTGGQINYLPNDGDDEVIDLAGLHGKERKPYRGQIRMVFQDPYGSLNPRMTVGQIIGEPLRTNKLAGKRRIRDRVNQMLELVGLRADYATRYPHAFSGGERQRIGIARALITEPRLVVADEAVSALDVSVRAQVLSLLADLQAELNLTYIFISHDLSVVRTICDRVAVMYFGRIVEQGDTADLYDDPQHPYTRSLLSAVPVPDPRLRGTRKHTIYHPDEDTP
ncbi:MAG TPA: ABC transporter ATP-binding protein [Mycobacteriales bacterium]|nr:ABC transporter ATP-binding protein [Mycobacteriales bacterium]